MGHSKNTTERGVHSIPGPPQETGRSQINTLTASKRTKYKHNKQSPEEVNGRK